MRVVAVVAMLVTVPASAESKFTAEEDAIMRLVITYQCIAATGDKSAYLWAKAKAAEDIGASWATETANGIEATPPEMGVEAAPICVDLIGAMRAADQ